MTHYIGIVGTRSFPNWWTERQIQVLVYRLLDEDPETVIVTGGDDKSGDGGLTDQTAARFARAWAHAHGKEDNVIVFSPKKNAHGKWASIHAGLDRNTQIVETATGGVYAFWNGQSRGTRDTIQKAFDCGRLRGVYFSNGFFWSPENLCNPLWYGDTMVDQFDNLRLAQVLCLRLKANRKSRLNRHPDGSIDASRLDYADGRTIAAFGLLQSGVRPYPGIETEDLGCWFVPSENKRRKDVRPHRLDLKGTSWCDCDAVTKGHRECFAMYLVWMYVRLVAPNGLEVEDGDDPGIWTT